MFFVLFLILANFWQFKLFLYRKVKKKTRRMDMGCEPHVLLTRLLKLQTFKKKKQKPAIYYVILFKKKYEMGHFKYPKQSYNTQKKQWSFKIHKFMFKKKNLSHCPNFSHFPVDKGNFLSMWS